MQLIEIVVIAVGLSMDAFAISVAEGMILHTVEPRHSLRVAAYFGISQGLMPVLGYVMGTRLRGFIDAWDHWVAFALLVIIGGKMILDTVTRFETHEPEPRGESSHRRMMALAVATSIDALAVGVTLGLHADGIWAPAIIIGAITGIICTVGIHLGDRTGSVLGRYGELLGGTALCIIGIRILWDGLAG
jgi:putative Mn2+ efflux pump MntP